MVFFFLYIFGISAHSHTAFTENEKKSHVENVVRTRSWRERREKKQKFIVILWLLASFCFKLGSIWLSNLYFKIDHALQCVYIYCLKFSISFRHRNCSFHYGTIHTCAIINCSVIHYTLLIMLIFIR